MQLIFTETPHCRKGVHCETCRARTEAGQQWRDNISQHFIPPKDWTCPFGVDWDTGATNAKKLLRKLKLGDKIEKITRTVGIQPCGGCKERKRILNGE